MRGYVVRAAQGEQSREKKVTAINSKEDDRLRQSEQGSESKAGRMRRQ
jgi:hypothetical protein